MDGNAKHDQRCHEQDTMDRLAQCGLTSGTNPLDAQLQGRDNNICCKDGKVGVDLCFDASLLVINEVINWSIVCTSEGGRVRHGRQPEDSQKTIKGQNRDVIVHGWSHCLCDDIVGLGKNGHDGLISSQSSL